jgi:hypothetical protein
MAVSKFKNLNIYGELTSVRVIENKAFISFVFVATERVVPSKTFRIFVEENKQLSPANNLTYWVNKKNILYGEQQNSSEEVNVNSRYEEILEFDISQSGYALLVDNRWKRIIRIVVLDSTTDEQVWISETLNLISEEIKIPEIEYISLKTFSTDLGDDDSIEEVKCRIGLVYLGSKNINFINESIRYEIKLVDTFSKKQIGFILLKQNESEDLNESTSVLEYIFSDLKLTAPVTFVLNIVTQSGTSLYKKKKTFIPIKPKNKLFVKENGLVKEVVAIYANTVTGENAVNNESFYYNEKGLYISE